MLRDTLIICLLTSTASFFHQVAAWNDAITIEALQSEVPAPFSDTMLPVNMDIARQEFDPLVGRVVMLPKLRPTSSIDSMPTKFSIYTRRSSTEGIEFRETAYLYNGTQHSYQFDLSRILQSDFNPTRKTVIMIAGYLSAEVEPWITTAKDLWLELEDVNFIRVSWSESNRIFYSTAMTNTPIVARQTTIMIYYLATLKGVDFRDETFLKSIHFIGHSLGAHIGAFFGQDFNGKVGRITGLDPAGPGFDHFHFGQRLDYTDALFVDVIHTNAGKMMKLNAAVSGAVHVIGQISKNLPLVDRMIEYFKSEYTGEGDTAWFGIDAKIGHIDYYANDGRTQPGCEGLMHICDHARAHEIYLDILRHELNLRNAGYSSEERKHVRLMAFNARDYESFLSGSNWGRNCPYLMRLGEHLTERVAETMRSCSIPIDPLTPIDELIDELRTKHGIRDLAGEDNYDDYVVKKKYYFKTVDSLKTLVGDHYLLKIYLSESPTWDPNQCSLEAKLHIDDQNVITVRVNDFEKQSDGLYTSTMALPFVLPFDATSGTAVEGTDLNGMEDKLEIFKHFMLPERVRITIISAKSKGVMEVIKSSLTKIWKGPMRPMDCAMSIGMVEVHPIVASRRNFAGIYGFSSHMLNESVRLNIYPAHEQVKIPWTEEFISRLQADATMSTSRTLTALVVS